MKHTPDVANDVMLGRLDRIVKGDLTATDIDMNFYAHEFRELELKFVHKMDHDAAHQQALKDYGIDYEKGYQNKIYTQEAIDAGDAALLEGY